MHNNIISNQAFTIVEMLVVISIILVMVALLLPVVMRAREAAYLYYCGSTMRMLGQAHLAYATDYNDGITPYIRNGHKYGLIDTNWHILLRPYGKEILEDETLLDEREDWVQCPKYKHKYNSYARNNNVGFTAKSAGTNYWPVKFSQIPNPGDTVLMMEAPNFGCSHQVLYHLGRHSKHYYPTAHYGEFAKNPKNGRMEWINGIANFLFSDGHVEGIHTDNVQNRLDLEDVKPTR